MKMHDGELNIGADLATELLACQFNEHVLASLHSIDSDVGVQGGGQADVHQVHRAVGDQPVQVGAGGEPELAADLGKLLRAAAVDDHLVYAGRWA